MKLIEAIALNSPTDGPLRASVLFYDVKETLNEKLTEVEFVESEIKDKIEAQNSQYVKYHTHTVCQSKEHLLEETDKVILDKGEGMMIKCSKSKYERRRSELLLKVKKFYDAEATVTGHLKGTGRC